MMQVAKFSEFYQIYLKNMFTCKDIKFIGLDKGGSLSSPIFYKI